MAACRDIAKIFMPILLVEENPNKFLKLALDYRKNKTVMASYSRSQIENTEPLEEHDVTNPCDSYYIGLDRIGQFLNFCVLLRQLPTTPDNIFKTTEEIPKLTFDRDVIKELVRQVDDERKELDELIGQNKISEYQNKLDSYRHQYDAFSKNDKYSNETFCSWMTNHVRRNFSLGEHGPKPEITDKDELNKLLRLDAYSKCQTSIETLLGQDELKNISKSEIKAKQAENAENKVSSAIQTPEYQTSAEPTSSIRTSENSSQSEINKSSISANFTHEEVNNTPLDTQTLNFFQELWNSFMQLINADEKHFYKPEKNTVEFKENKIIPPKQPTEHYVPLAKDIKTNVSKNDITESQI